MQLKGHPDSRRSKRAKSPKPSPRSMKSLITPAPIDPNTTAVPFHVTAFAASVFEPPAISDAAEEEPLFDRTKAQRASKTKKR